MTIEGGISALKTAFSLAKGVTDLLKRPQVDASEVLARLMELQSLMLDAQSALGDAEEENRRLKKQIEELNQQQQIGAELVFSEEAYWRRKPDHGVDGPFCPGCWDNKSKLIRMLDNGTFWVVDTQEEGRSYRCPVDKVGCVIPVRVLKAKGIWTRG